MKIYAELNTSNQVIDESSNSVCPEGYVEMNERRPSENHIAKVDGTWEALKEE